MAYYTAIGGHLRSGMIDYRHKPVARPSLPISPPHNSPSNRPISRKPGQAIREKVWTNSLNEDTESLPHLQGSTERRGHGAAISTLPDFDVAVPDFLENAFSQLQHDRDVYDASEAMCGDAAQRLHHQQKPSPSRDTDARAKEFQRPSAPAATHPSCYNQHQRQQTPKMLLTPPPEPRKPRKLAQPKSKRAKFGEKEVAPLIEFSEEPARDKSPTPPADPRTFTDPKRLQSAEPPMWNPISGHLKIDTDPKQPKVLSPIFMIGLPFGDQIEMANDYNVYEVSDDTPEQDSDSHQMQQD